MGTPTSSRGPARCARRAARGAALAFVPRRAACFRFRQRREDPAKAKLDGVEMACMMGSYPAQPDAVILSRPGGPRAARPTPDAIRVRCTRLEHLAVSAVPSTGVQKAREAIVDVSVTVGGSKLRWHTALFASSKRTEEHLRNARRFAGLRGDFFFSNQTGNALTLRYQHVPPSLSFFLATENVERPCAKIPRALFRQRSPHACDSSNSKWTKSSCE